MSDKRFDVILKEVSGIHTEEGEYVFKNKQTLFIKREDDGWTLTVKKYDVYCYGYSVDEILQEYAENIIVAWKLYVECPESELTEDAKKLRKILESDLRKYDCIPK